MKIGFIDNQHTLVDFSDQWIWKELTSNSSNSSLFISSKVEKDHFATLQLCPKLEVHNFIH